MAKKKVAKKDIETSAVVVKEKHPGGRPTLYKEEYCEMLVQHMEQGYSFESFAGVLRVSRQTIYDWADRHQEFLDSKRAGTELSRLWWERTGHAGMFMGGKDNPFNSTVWVFSMKNRFGWKDRTEVTNKDIKSLSDEDLLKEAKELVKEIEGDS